VTYRPDPKAFAEACYVPPGGSMWRAVVYKTPDGWELKFGRTEKTDGFMPAGTFKNGKALVKFIREKAEERVGKGVKPIYDTLHKLKTSNPMSVVPDCYEPALAEVMNIEAASGGRGLPDCVACPYRSKCGEPSAQPEIIPAAEVLESEEVFRQRLQQKLKQRYGMTEDEKRLRDAAKNAFDALMDPALDDVLDAQRDEDE